MADIFEFLFDIQFRRLVARDYRELCKLDAQEHTKSVTVLSGSIIEGILCDALIASGEFSFEHAVKLNLSEMIGPAVKRGILPEEYLSQVTRTYRNLIHPGKEIRQSIVFDSSDASVAQHAVDIVIREVSRWARKHRERAEIKKKCTELTPSQIYALELFSTLPPKNSSFEHDWIEAETYSEIRSLICLELLSNSDTLLQRSHDEVLTMTDSVREVIDELQILSGPILRQKVGLSHSNIGASIAGGSGASPNSR